MDSALLVCKAFPPIVGGVETFSEQVARAYLRAGVQISVITQTHGKKGWQHRTYSEGSVALYNTGRGGQLATALKMLWRVFQTTRATSFNFYHATTWRPAMTLIAARRRAPLAITVHGREVLTTTRPLRPVMEAVLNSASTVAVVSTATRDRVDKHLGEAVKVSRWIVANNGLSFATGGERTASAVRPEYLRHRPVRFLTIARLVERKNIQGCLAALRSIRDAGHQNFEYKIAGTGPMADELRRQVSEAEMDAHVEFLGYVDDRDIPALYCWADVFLHPQIDLQDGQDFEGFGLSIADAMSFGCLAIAGTGSGPSDFIQHGITGILVDGQNNADISAAILATLNDPDPHRVIAAAGQDYVTKELSWDKHVGVVLSAIGNTQ